MGWELERFVVGDAVVDPARPKWGVGRVVEDRTFARSPTVGQRLLIKWAGRGLVSVFTAERVLRLSASAGGADAEPDSAADLRGRANFPEA